MKKIKVNAKNYTNYEYSAYLKRGNEIEKPKNATIEVGEVFYDKGNNAIGVVLGCIDEEFDGIVRLDSDGVTCIDDLEAVDSSHLRIDNLRCSDKLRSEIETAIDKSSLIRAAKDLLFAIDSNMQPNVKLKTGSYIQEQYISEELEVLRKALTIYEI